MGKLLVVVDYQNDFVDGSLGFKGAELLDARIAAKIDAYRVAGDEVVFTFDTHHANYLETLEGKNLPVAHCIEGTEGQALYGEVARRLLITDRLYNKPTFGSEELFMYLVERRDQAAARGEAPYESIEIVGLVANICVMAQAVLAKTACPEIEIVVDAACTDSFDPALREKTFDVMEGMQVRVDRSGLSEA